MFAHMNVEKIQETSLTLLHDKTSSESNDFQQMQDMQVHTFKLALVRKSN